MRRIRVVAWLSIVGAVAAPSPAPATPYASNVAISGGTTVNFLLNEPADALTYRINNGSAVALDGTTIGAEIIHARCSDGHVFNHREKDRSDGIYDSDRQRDPLRRPTAGRSPPMKLVTA